MEYSENGIHLSRSLNDGETFNKPQYSNETQDFNITEKGVGDEDEYEDYLFNQLNVKIPLLILYSIVFFFSFFGNLFMILVMILHRRMNSYTNFFLTNLAVADFFVSIFCVYQNFAMYIIKNWQLGEFLCQMYHFINTLSYTASVIILVVVSGERYLAIVEPLKAKIILTKRKMVITMFLVWLFSALYSFPRFLYFKVATYPVNGDLESMCILRRDLFDTRTWDIISLVLLYLLPLAFLTYLYNCIAQALYKSEKVLSQSSDEDMGTFASAPSFCHGKGMRHLYFSKPCYTGSSRSPTHSRPSKIQGSFKSVMSTYISVRSSKKERGVQRAKDQKIIPSRSGENLKYKDENHPGQSACNREEWEEISPLNGDSSSDSTPKRKINGRGSKRLSTCPIIVRPSSIILKARRKVIHMLIIVVACFALLSLPFHTRKMLQYFLPRYNHTAPFAYVFTPITYLLMYSHSAVNPILYMAMSRRLRSSVKDLLSCRTMQEDKDPQANHRRIDVKFKVKQEKATVTHL